MYICILEFLYFEVRYEKLYFIYFNVKVCVWKFRQDIDMKRLFTILYLKYLSCYIEVKFG